MYVANYRISGTFDGDINLAVERISINCQREGDMEILMLYQWIA